MMTAGTAFAAAVSGCGDAEKKEQQQQRQGGDTSETGLLDRSPPPGFELPIEEPEVRVLVQRMHDPSLVQLQIGGVRQWLRVRSIDMHGWGVALLGPLTIIRDRDGWMVTDRTQMRAAVHSHQPLHISPLGAVDSALQVEQRRYPGTVRLVARDQVEDQVADAPVVDDRVADDQVEQQRGAPAEPHEPASKQASSQQITRIGVDIVNYVRVEQYLPGVLARELFQHWGEPTFAAQAVAARSFATQEHLHYHSRRHFDLTSTQRSQVYAGLVENGAAAEGAAATRGLLLGFMIDGSERLVPGYYSSCCGGIAASAVDAIGENPINDIRPLQGHGDSCPCDQSPTYRWRTSRPRAVFQKRALHWASAHNVDEIVELESVHRIEISERNLHGRPSAFDIVDRAGKRATISARRLRQMANHSSSTIPQPRASLRSSFVTVTATDDEHVFDGAGHGHGAGLCQYGAQAQAADGATWRSIIEYYYPGAKVTQAW